MSLSRKPRPLAVVADRADRADRVDPAPSLAEQALAYADELYGLARHLCSTTSDAEDIVQETYARAIGGAARLTPGSNLRAWLFRILRNGFIDLARRKKIVLEIPDDTLDTRPAETASLEQLRYITASEVARAIASLPVEYRLVVLLEVEGFSEAEIADIAHCAPGTVKSRLSRAKVKLRVALQETR